MRWSWVEPAAGGLIAATVAGIGMAAGFAHTIAAAERAGQTGLFAWACAVVIECMVLVAGWQLLVDRRAGRSVTFPVAVLVVAFTIQMGAQVSGAPRTFAGWLFAAVPALGCLVVIKLVARGLVHPKDSAVAVPPVSADESPELVHADADRADVDQVGDQAERALEAPAPVSTWPPRQ